MISSVTLGFHAEKLHEKHVWQKVERIAGLMAETNIKATFFVYPFPAAVANKSISKRVQWLGALGHEIAQHTHFYAGSKIAKHEKRDDFSRTNVVHCIYRDFTTLTDFGFTPKGFTAGSWFVNDTVLDALVELGFVYDCSAQLPKKKKSNVGFNNLWLSTPQCYSNDQGRLLCLPTTCSLGQWFKWGRNANLDSDPSYRIVYLHDYDLLSLKQRLLLLCFMRLMKRIPLEQSAIIAKRFLLRQDLCHERRGG